tara:strand:+ start:493 stop:702 length:210 start_codon:yes stop_codon:yes gene_type:complete
MCGPGIEMFEFDDELSDTDKKELEKLLKEITKEAKKVVKDYAKNPSDMSGSLVTVHQNSPVLKKKNSDS